MDVSLGFLRAMEVGRKWPNLDMLFIIAKALDVRPPELIAAVEDEAKSWIANSNELTGASRTLLLTLFK